MRVISIPNLAEILRSESVDQLNPFNLSYYPFHTSEVGKKLILANKKEIVAFVRFSFKVFLLCVGPNFSIV